MECKHPYQLQFIELFLLIVLMQLDLLLKHFQLKSTDEIAPLIYAGLVNPLLSLRMKVGHEKCFFYEVHIFYVAKIIRSHFDTEHSSFKDGDRIKSIEKVRFH